MKKRLLVFLFMVVWLPVISQVKQNKADNNQAKTTGNTYAVIIGIANYENENINLNYANRDAEVFAGYLQSNASGAVPTENIRLLIDTKAYPSFILYPVSAPWEFVWDIWFFLCMAGYLPVSWFDFV